jgi:methylamine utilization protein MauJ
LCGISKIRTIHETGRVRKVNPENTFILCRAGFPLQAEYSANFGNALEGDSHLAIARPANQSADPGIDRIKVDVAAEGSTFRFLGYPNARGFLAKIIGRCEAQDFLDAHRKCFKVLAPLLSNWSLQLDVPLVVYQVDLLEIGSGATRMTFMPPFQTTPLVCGPRAALTSDIRGYASLYREALNSNSPVYQFLCYFKIIESVRQRRARLGAEARARGESFG